MLVLVLAAFASYYWFIHPCCLLHLVLVLALVLALMLVLRVNPVSFWFYPAGRCWCRFLVLAAFTWYCWFIHPCLLLHLVLVLALS